MIKNSNYFRILGFFIFSLYSFQSYSQQLKGKIQDDHGQPIAGINILVKKSITDTAVLKYAISDDIGYYSISLNSPLDKFIVEFKSFAYKTKIIEIKEFAKKQNPYILNISLENDLTKLEEVTVKSEKRPITVKNDTTTYNLSKFKDGTEKVIEDLIKKLPGIKVEENGKLTFKGKTVESVLLDGDDLFGSNYTIGTKNIDIDMVDGLSAIENYIKNPLLHGIDNTDAVAINLNLKKEKTDFSNTTNLAMGIENRTDVNTSLLGISKKHKSFSTVTFNNIGKEYSPYNSFSSNNASLEDAKEESLNPIKVIQDGNFNTDISEERSRIGNNFFTSVNSIYNFTKKLKGKLNVDYKKDKIEQTLINQTDYVDVNNSLNIFQKESVKKKPELYNIKLDLDYKLSNNELLESKTKVKNEKTNTLFDIALNDNLQKSITNSESKQIKQILNYTNKLTKKSALISEVLFNKSKLSQDLLINPDLRFSDSINNIFSNQSVKIKKNSFKLNAFYLQSGQDYNLKIGGGYIFEENHLFSLLTCQDSNTPFSNNDFKYKNSYPWVEANLFYKLEHWSFRPSFKARYLFQELENQKSISGSKKNTKYQFLPKLNIIYSFNKISNIKFIGQYNEKLVTENRLYEEVIFISNRGAQKNSASLTPLKSYSFNLSFNHNDFFNLFQFSSGINYSINKNNYFNTIDINNLFTFNSSKLLNENFDNISLNSNIDKYVGFLKSNVRFNLSYNISSYKNIINNSELRDNSINSLQSELNIKTGFLGIINFENNFKYRNSTFHSNGLDNIKNTSLQNSSKIYLRPTKNIRIGANFDYYLPDLNKPQDFLFFDTSLTFSSKNGKIDYSIISKNITPNKNIFKRTDITDYSISTFSYNLQNPYLLFSISFKL